MQSRMQKNKELHDQMQKESEEIKNIVFNYYVQKRIQEIYEEIGKEENVR